MKNYFYIALIIVLGIVFSSCNEETSVAPKGSPNITKISVDSASIGDTVTVLGENFIGDETRYRVQIDTFAYVDRADCIIWQNNLITFVVPDSAKSGELKIKLNENYSNGKILKIRLFPIFDVVEIPAGKFIMGSETGFSNELPVREVTITNSFYISKFEVSQRLYKAIMNSNPSITKDLNNPVDSVDWNDAIVFCNELSKLMGLDTAYNVTGSGVLWNQNANGWRLPTEAEWEYSARDTTTGDYSGSGLLELMGWFNENSGMKPHNSGFKKPNLYGIYDMHGNVWEYCWDWYQFDYYGNSGNIQNPTGPVSGTRRVLRGGSWSDGKGYARSANRNIPEKIGNNKGIRIVRTKK